MAGVSRRFSWSLHCTYHEIVLHPESEAWDCLYTNVTVLLMLSLAHPRPRPPCAVPSPHTSTQPTFSIEESLVLLCHHEARRPATRHSIPFLTASFSHFCSCIFTDTGSQFHTPGFFPCDRLAWNINPRCLRPDPQKASGRAPLQFRASVFTCAPE
jgi:hypothetical protein